MSCNKSSALPIPLSSEDVYSEAMYGSAPLPVARHPPDRGSDSDRDTPPEPRAFRRTSLYANSNNGSFSGSSHHFPSTPPVLATPPRSAATIGGDGSKRSSSGEPSDQRPNGLAVAAASRSHDSRAGSGAGTATSSAPASPFAAQKSTLGGFSAVVDVGSIVAAAAGGAPLMASPPFGVASATPSAVPLVAAPSPNSISNGTCYGPSPLGLTSSSSSGKFYDWRPSTPLLNGGLATGNSYGAPAAGRSLGASSYNEASYGRQSWDCREPSAATSPEAQGSKTSRLDGLHNKRRNLSPMAASKVRRLLRKPTVLHEATGAPKKTLVLDLDETLVHSTALVDGMSASDAAAAGIGAVGDVCEECPAAFRVTSATNKHGIFPVHVQPRPHLEAFLDLAAELFEVVVFTASEAFYADQVIDRLDPRKKRVHHRLYREHCLRDEVQKNVRVKDISLLGRPLDQVVIVDDTPMNYMFQPYNAIPVAAWLGEDPTDTVLLDLMPTLRRLADASTVYDVLDERDSDSPEPPM